jgi:hypothetical protein
MISNRIKINFVIFSPFEVYVEHIGGATVPHTLANVLSSLGENVYLYANSTNPKYNKVTCIPYGTEIDFDDSNTIVIFVSGAGEHTYSHKIPNCLKRASNIVRWLVNNQDRNYNPNDKLYVYHKYWDVFDNQRVDGVLSVIEHDHNLFRDRGLHRSGTCYLIKGNLDTELDRIIHSDEDLCIDTVLYQQTDKMKFLADLFNKKELFISYTPFSYMSVLAASCGCKSLVIPKKYYNGIMFDKQKWYSDIWCTKYGIACGVEDLLKKSEELDQVVPYIKYYEEFIQHNQVKQFINDCYNWVYEKYKL